MTTLRFSIAMVLGILLPLLVQRWDRRRLPTEQRERAWNTASWGAALYAFGPLSMLGWCWVTRGGAWPAALRLLAGVLAAAAIMGIIEGVDLVVAVMTGTPE